MADPVPQRDPGEPARAAVGIVGAGTMGAGIAQVALEAGERVILYDALPEAGGAARSRIADGLARRLRHASGATPGATAASVAEVLSRLEIAADPETLATSADLVIEAVVEDLATKRAMFARLDGAAAASTILASNTSALSIGAIAEAAERPGRVVGLHFFNPVPLMPLVEVVGAATSDPAAVDLAAARVTAWGKTAVRSADTPGFIVNRVNRPFTLEALAALEHGDGSVASIDRAFRAAGYPMGPFELMDLVGIDVNLAAARGIFEATQYEIRFRPSVIQERLVEAGRFGRKTGEGFYWYGEDGRSLGVAGAFASPPEPLVPLVPPDRTLSSGTSPADPPTDPTQVLERVELTIVNEAWCALGEAVATATDIDLAMRLGAGHPLGPFERTAALGGPGAVLARLERWSAAGERFAPASALVAAAGQAAGR